MRKLPGHVWHCLHPRPETAYWHSKTLGSHPAIDYTVRGSGTLTPGRTGPLNRQRQISPTPSHQHLHPAVDRTGPATDTKFWSTTCWTDSWGSTDIWERHVIAAQRSKQKTKVQRKPCRKMTSGKGWLTSSERKEKIIYYPMERPQSQRTWKNS